MINRSVEADVDSPVVFGFLMVCLVNLQNESQSLHGIKDDLIEIVLLFKKSV